MKIGIIVNSEQEENAENSFSISEIGIEPLASVLQQVREQTQALVEAPDSKVIAVLLESYLKNLIKTVIKI